MAFQMVPFLNYLDWSFKATYVLQALSDAVLPCRAFYLQLFYY